jgi:NAD(P)-dependent dehydrogenase (short-subunit alcohol dehydrogenase family)
VINAGRSNGHRIARALLYNGWRVVITSRRSAELVGSIHSHSWERAMAIAADCTDSRQLAELLRRVRGRFGSPVGAVLCGCDATPQGDHTHCCARVADAVARSTAADAPDLIR